MTGRPPSFGRGWCGALAILLCTASFGACASPVILPRADPVLSGLHADVADAVAALDAERAVPVYTHCRADGPPRPWPRRRVP